MKLLKPPHRRLCNAGSGGKAENYLKQTPDGVAGFDSGSPENRAVEDAQPARNVKPARILLDLHGLRQIDEPSILREPTCHEVCGLSIFVRASMIHCRPEAVFLRLLPQLRMTPYVTLAVSFQKSGG